MPQGNWTCSGCGGAITELPFEPRNTAGLKCRDCFSKSRGDSSSAPRQGSGGGERTMYEGDWTCSGCKSAITKLPFQPRDTTNLKCMDCFKQSR